jgi:hypothetical protein
MCSACHLFTRCAVDPERSTARRGCAHASRLRRGRPGRPPPCTTCPRPAWLGFRSRKRLGWLAKGWLPHFLLLHKLRAQQLAGVLVQYCGFASCHLPVLGSLCKNHLPVLGSLCKKGNEAGPRRGAASLLVSISVPGATGVTNLKIQCGVGDLVIGNSGIGGTGSRGGGGGGAGGKEHNKR